MDSQKTFNSKVKEVGRFAQSIGNEQIKNEPMFFNSSIEFAYEKGGSITRSFIDNLPNGWHDEVVFDSRVHMLMKDWFPAIPGFHHDDVPRPKIPVGQHFISAGQPDYDNPRYHSEHILGLVNADVCPTQFALGESTFSMIPDGELIYRKWHEEVLQKLANGDLVSFNAQDRSLYQFDWQTWHTGVKSLGHGWRWFGRVSRKTDRVQGVTNEIRVNAQVYLEFPMDGW